MIRKSQSEDMASILALWMKSTIYAHPFIEERYWHESEAIVRDVYLPAAQTWVWEENGQLKGFVSVLEARFVGALFVAPDALRHGIGKALLEYVQQRFPLLSLEVYQKNQSAVSGSAGPVYFSNQTSAVLPAQPFPSRELGRSFVRTFTAPFLHMPPAVGSGSGHAPS